MFESYLFLKPQDKFLHKPCHEKICALHMQTITMQISVQYCRLMATLLFTIYIVLILVPIEKPMLQKLTLP